MVTLADKTLGCIECGLDFLFTAGEQEFFKERGFEEEPKRCRSCRAARRSFPSNREDRKVQQGTQQQPQQQRQNYTQKVYHSTICMECGAEARVPFVPSGDRPVYCRECFIQKKEAGEIG